MADLPTNDKPERFNRWGIPEHQISDYDDSDLYTRAELNAFDRQEARERWPHIAGWKPPPDCWPECDPCDEDAAEFLDRLAEREGGSDAA